MTKFEFRNMCYCDSYHPSELHRNPDGITEYRGGKSLNDAGSAEESAPIKEPGQESESVGTPAYQAIFEGVYDQIQQWAPGRTPEEKGKWFIDCIAQKVPMHILEIESRNLTNEDIYQEIWKKMSSYIERYKGTSKFEEKKQGVLALYLKLTKHINTLLQNGEVDPLTAKVFARYLRRYKHIGELLYGGIVANNQELPDGVLQQKASEYSDALRRLVAYYGEDAKEQESGGFMHFNPNAPTGETTTRIYINPDLAQSPARVLDAWYQSLVRSGLKDKIYFKVPSGLSKRQEGIVVYLGDQTNPDDVEKLLRTFLATCSPDLLFPPMPSAVPLARGIAMAPELGNINTFLRCSGVEKEPGVPQQISYNEWVASSIHLAFELAYHEAITNGARIVTPRILRGSAGGYFQKIVKLSGINPETMVLNALGGKKPSWAARLA